MRISLRDSFQKAPAHVVGKAHVIDHNTFLYKTEEGREVIRLHLTDIFERMPDGRIKVTSGGWKTMTTKARLNDALRSYGYRLDSDKGVWKVSNGADRVPFIDGMILPDAFSGEARAQAQAHADAQAALKRDIKRFVTKTIVTGQPLPLPGSGDCWYCMMFDAEPEPGQPKYLGNDSEKEAKPRGSTDHLLSHIEEGYMHGSLIVNAFRNVGYSNHAISYIAFSDRPDYTRVRRTVSRYLQKRLGLTF